jgi:hypothetical protein
VSKWIAILALGSFSANRDGSLNSRTIRQRRLLKRCIVAAMLLLAMSKEALVVESPGFRPTQMVLAGALISLEPFDATPPRHDAKPVQRITKVQKVAKKDYLITYFLDQVPGNISVSTTPQTAHDIIVARVNLAERPAYLVGRDQSGRPSTPPKSPFRAQLKIREVFSGSAKVGESFDVTFGSFNSSGKRHLRPYTSNQLGREYVVVIYIDDGNQRRLAGFPIDEAQYLKWESEIRGFEGPPPSLRR